MVSVIPCWGLYVANVGTKYPIYICHPNQYSAHFPEDLHWGCRQLSPIFCERSFSSTLAIVTILANLVVLLAMRRVTSIRLPSKLLLCSLVMTDLGAGLIVLLHHIVCVMRRSIPDSAVCFVYMGLRFTGYVLSSASLLTLVAISVNRIGYVSLFCKREYGDIFGSTRIREHFTDMTRLKTWKSSPPGYKRDVA